MILAAFSRFTVGRMTPTKATEDLLLGMWQLRELLGRVPRRLLWGIGRGPHPSEGVPALMGTLVTKLVLLPPRDPESKEIEQRRDGCLRPATSRTRSSRQCNEADKDRLYEVSLAELRPLHLGVPQRGDENSGSGRSHATFDCGGHRVRGDPLNASSRLTGECDFGGRSPVDRGCDLLCTQCGPGRLTGPALGSN